MKTVKIDDASIVCPACFGKLEVEVQIINVGKAGDPELGCSLCFGIIRPCGHIHEPNIVGAVESKEIPGLYIGGQQDITLRDIQEHQLDDEVYSWLVNNYKSLQPGLPIYDDPEDEPEHKCFSGEEDFMPRDGVFGNGFYCSVCGNYHSTFFPF